MHATADEYKRGAFCLLPTLLQALALAERSQSMVLIEPRTLPLSQITCDLMHAWQGAWTEATVLRLVQAETFLRQQGVQRAATEGQRTSRSRVVHRSGGGARQVAPHRHDIAYCSDCRFMCGIPWSHRGPAIAIVYTQIESDARHRQNVCSFNDSRPLHAY
jgi:hypothetical protein